MDTADQKVTRRADVESEYNGNRDQIEREYRASLDALDEQRRADLADNETAKRAAFAAAGLNSDGSDPQERPQG